MTRCTMQCEHKSQCINYTIHTIHHADDDCYFNEYFGGGRDSGGTAWNMERKAVTLVPAAANPARIIEAYLMMMAKLIAESCRESRRPRISFACRVWSVPDLR